MRSSIALLTASTVLSTGPLVGGLIPATAWAAAAGPPPAPEGATPTPPKRGAELSGDEGGVIPYNTCKKQPRGAKFRVTLPKETELEDLINWMSSISCQKFIWDRKVRSSKVSVISPEEVTIDQAYGAFYAALEQMGLTVEPSGDYYKIVETTDAKSRNLPVYEPGSRAPSNDRYVIKLIRTKAANTKDLVDLLNKLKSKQGSVDSIGDMIILTDNGSSVERLTKIMNQVDDPAVAGEKVFFYQLQYASAEEVATIIREIFGEGAAAGAARGGAKRGPTEAEPRFSRVIVDDRTGTLIIVAQEGHYQVIRRLIEQLDVPMALGGGRIHVVKLRNADPQEVSNVLSQLASGAISQAAKRGDTKGAPAAQTAPGTAELFSGEIKVTPDPATRSLVILASQRDFLSLRPVIDRLDAERKQVFLEVYLLEVTIQKTIQGGAAGHFGAPFDVTTNGTTAQGLGFVASAPGSNSVLFGPEILQGLAGGAIGPRVPGSGALLGTPNDIPAFGVLLQALQSSADVNILAEPSLYMADNQEATIEVGSNVPTPGALAFPGGSGGGGGLIPVQSIQRENVTLRVRVKPYINDENTVTLDVEMDDRNIQSQDPRLGVTTGQRRLKLDKVVAHNDLPVVLGGLIKEEEREGVIQVPGLGSIPLLGWLFKKKTKERRKLNLMMIMIPHIIETPDDVRRIHEQRARERQEFLERETAFKRRDLPSNINFRKKGGLLASVDREARRMEQELAAVTKAEEELKRKDITGEIGLSPGRTPGREESESQAAPGPTISPDQLSPPPMPAPEPPPPR